MKIIFLGIEGVLITDIFLDKSNRNNPPPFDKECVQAFNEILSKTNAIIVLTSHWKKVWDLKRLDFIFKFNGVVKSPLDVTDNLDNREKEITDYVQRKAINDFIILDHMQLSVFPRNFIHCNRKEGVKQPNIKEQAINILQKQFSRTV